MNLDPAVKPREIPAPTDAPDYGGKVLITNNQTSIYSPTPITPLATILSTSSNAESRLNHLKRYIAAMCLLLPLGFLVNTVNAQQPAVIKLEETIRGNQEQPKVLTIVPWQSPKTKQALPSPIVERINKKFVPLQRDELKLQIQILNTKNIPRP
jgi:hypothetical protein